MIMLQRKIKCKFTGSEDYQPEGIPRDRWLPVIGWETRKREKEYQGTKQWVEDIFYHVTNEKGKLVCIASFNCSTMIDEKAEVDLNLAIELLKNSTVIGKAICEKMATFPDRKGSETDTGKG